MLNYLSLFGFLIVASTCVQILNIFAIYSGRETVSLFHSALKIAFYGIPLTFIATVCFTLYYAKGAQLTPYPVLMIYGYGVAFLMSIVVQVLLVKTAALSTADMISALLVTAGVALSIFNKLAAPLPAAAG